MLHVQKFGDPVHRDITGNMTSLWRRDVSTDIGGGGRCEFLVDLAFPTDAVRDAGAPRVVTINVSVSSGRVEWDVYTVGKRPTRLAESIFFTFNPVRLPSYMRGSLKNSYVKSPIV
jgi:hypothetical protein